MQSTSAAQTPDWKSTACILCECNCGIEVQLGGDDGRKLVRIRGDDAHPSSAGYACEKAARLDFYQNGPHRLTQPLRRRADGTFEEIDWDTAIREVAARFAAVRDAHGGESILYYGGGGQGNHLPGAYSRATRTVLGSRYRSSALAQEKTGEFWVAHRMVGGYTRGDFAHCEVALFIGKNPWISHGIPRARLTLREIARDPQRCLIVIDPRRSETADLADIHLRVRPGADAFLLAALVAVIVREDLVAHEWIDTHADGATEVLPHFAQLSVAEYCARSGVPEDLVRDAARRIAKAESVASFEDLGVQMNRHSTLVSYLHKLLVLLTGNFGKKGTAHLPSAIVPLATGGDGGAGAGKRTPVTDARIIGGLIPCNAIPDEILTDHPQRFRALLVESANPAHSLADSARMREALAALDLVVVIDVAMSETARVAHYVLPVASQFEKAEATFFNFEFPDNCFHLRRALMQPPPGLFSEAELHARLVEALGGLPQEPIALLRAAWKQGRNQFRTAFSALASANPRLMGIAPVVLYRAIGDLLPEGYAEAAAVWGMCQVAAQRQAKSLARAGFAGAPPDAADALFDALLTRKSAVVFSVDEWDESFARARSQIGRIQLAIPELFADALRINPGDAQRIGVADGGRVRVTTRRGSVDTVVETTDRMLPGHVSLPNGLGVDFPGSQGVPVATGVSPNDLTHGDDCDWLARTPWHKHTPARVESL
jgi:anaerobic selenocysteine-containing dehydrogenase